VVIDTLAVIPARGGSTELKRKNLLPIDGTPMFLHSAHAARDAGCQVVISTDDAEIRSTAIVAGFTVHDRGPELADVVVDEVVKAATEGWDGPILLVQPTVQPITAEILTDFIRNTSEVGCLTADNTHQLWSNGGWITPRVNRQDRPLSSLVAQELGIRYWATVADIGKAPTPVPMPFSVNDLVDIDTASDYRSITIPRCVALWPIADQTHGMGHLRRCLAIAEQLQHHHIEFVIDDVDDDMLEILVERGWPFETFAGITDDHTPDLWILDRLDNTDMPQLDGKVVTFEDESDYPDDVKIDALYEDGVDWCVLRPEFTAGSYHVTDQTHSLKLLVMFGGTDPSRLGARISELFPHHQLEWIQAGDDKPVAELMHQADILITSAGRTVFEAAAVGIPTIVLAQNLRETTHTHLGYRHGNIYLGLGKLVTDRQIQTTVATLEADTGLRHDLSVLGRPDGLGLQRIVHRIEALLGGL